MSHHHYDAEAVEIACQFIESLTLTKAHQGQPFRLLDFQRQILSDVIGKKNEDATRLIRRVWIGCARKNGKSELLAALALLFLFVDIEPSPEIYSLGADREQASIIFESAKKMIRADPYLDSITTIVDSKKLITNRLSGGIYRALSSEGSTKHGLAPSVVLIDELHAWLKPSHKELYDSMTSGSGSRRSPLFLTITTAGFNKRSICYQQYEYAKKVIDDPTLNPSYAAYIWEASIEDDWTDPETWKKANPGLGTTVTIESLQDACHLAQTDPDELNKFLRLSLNVWVDADVQYISTKHWDASAGTVELEELKGQVCFGGLDLSSKEDVTACVLSFPREDGSIKVLPFFFIPEDDLESRSRKDGVPYARWVKEGLVIATPGNQVDQAFVLKKIEELAAVYQIKEIAVDRWGATFISPQIEALGITAIGFGQGFYSMSQPTKELKGKVLAKLLHHAKNPVLLWMNGCLSVDEDAASNVKPHKPSHTKSTARVDGMVALVMSLDRLLRNKEQEESIYETRGLLVFG